ncbi:MAG: preprotein translocase subunit SecA [bacterium]|nr:preprotein translocase subunit SecA [bacterium]
MLNFLSRFVDTNRKEVERLTRIVDRINKLDSSVKKLKDSDFSGKTEEFKKRLEKGESLEDILPEAFALVREASLRTIGKRHYDTQLMAGIALFEGKIAEQKTGEGKTLSAVPPLYLRALTGNGVNLVTVNDYLARRDAGWNGPIFALLGLKVSSLIQEGKSFVYDPEYRDDSHGDERLAHLRPANRKEAYSVDITYGTNNEFGFDYLRDNMVSDLTELRQRSHYFAIIDEVDSVLIDEARTPLIISQPDAEPTDKYYRFADIIKNLKAEDYTIDEKAKSATLTEAGIIRVEKLLGVTNLYEKDFDTLHHIENALRARLLYLIDRDYVVKDDSVTIVDEFTGRLMFGRRWSDGLHQAVEAKEGVKIQQESKTLATISFQNYFRLYEVLAGMTGTAATEAEEFHKIYKLEVVAIPTYKPTARVDYPDIIYKTAAGKYEAVADEVNEARKYGRPTLVGTTSIDKNEIISSVLKKKGVPHQVLNAKNHEKEASILAKAGEPGAVTVATNMAGRGVDIILGGALPEMKQGSEREKFEKSKTYQDWQKKHDEVVKAGGLHVIGTERHESRRIDNQLRGRSGRLGDAGSSRFFLSLEDDLMRIFGGEKISGIMDALKIPEDQPIENGLISRAIEQAQVKVEGFHFDARKHVVEYDDVANQQRSIVYKLRREILESANLKEEISQKLKEQAQFIVNTTFSVEKGESPNHESLLTEFLEVVPFDDNSQKALFNQLKSIKEQEKVEELLLHLIEQSYETREKQLGEKQMRDIEKFAYLSSIDHLWIEHLDNLEDLREGIGLRGYGQREPLVEYKNEAFELFDKLMANIDANLTRRIFRIVPTMATQPVINVEQAQTNEDASDGTGLSSGKPTKTKPIVNKNKNVGRNDPCPCGSGLKYKKCGLINAPQHKG